MKRGAGIPRVEDLLNSDESVYEYFDFADTDQDYLGRRASRTTNDEEANGDDDNDALEF